MSQHSDIQEESVNSQRIFPSIDAISLSSSNEETHITSIDLDLPPLFFPCAQDQGSTERSQSLYSADASLASTCEVISRQCTITPEPLLSHERPVQRNLHTRLSHPNIQYSMHINNVISNPSMSLHQNVHTVSQPANPTHANKLKVPSFLGRPSVIINSSIQQREVDEKSKIITQKDFPMFSNNTLSFMNTKTFATIPKDTPTTEQTNTSIKPSFSVPVSIPMTQSHNNSNGEKSFPNLQIHDLAYITSMDQTGDFVVGSIPYGAHQLSGKELMDCYIPFSVNPSKTLDIKDEIWGLEGTLDPVEETDPIQDIQINVMEVKNRHSTASLDMVIAEMVNGDNLETSCTLEHQLSDQLTPILSSHPEPHSNPVCSTLGSSMYVTNTDLPVGHHQLSPPLLSFKSLLGTDYGGEYIDTDEDSLSTISSSHSSESGTLHTISQANSTTNVSILLNSTANTNTSIVYISLDEHLQSANSHLTKATAHTPLILSNATRSTVQYDKKGKNVSREVMSTLSLQEMSKQNQEKYYYSNHSPHLTPTLSCTYSSSSSSNMNLVSTNAPVLNPEELDILLTANTRMLLKQSEQAVLSGSVWSSIQEYVRESETSRMKEYHASEVLPIATVPVVNMNANHLDEDEHAQVLVGSIREHTDGYFTNLHKSQHGVRTPEQTKQTVPALPPKMPMKPYIAAPEKCQQDPACVLVEHRNCFMEKLKSKERVGCGIPVPPQSDKRKAVITRDAFCSLLGSHTASRGFKHMGKLQRPKTDDQYSAVGTGPSNLTKGLQEESQNHDGVKKSTVIAPGRIVQINVDTVDHDNLIDMNENKTGIKWQPGQQNYSYYDNPKENM